MKDTTPTISTRIEELMRIAEMATGPVGYGVTPAFDVACRKLLADFAEHITPEDNEIDKFTEEIMQNGLNVAMGGTPFKSEEENAHDNELAYENYKKQARTQLKALITKRTKEYLK